MLLDGKIALVTGAGQGVGQGIALALAAEGAAVAVTGRTLEKLEATCALIAERGGQALPVVCDVKSATSLEQCLAGANLVTGTGHTYGQAESMGSILLFASR